MEQEHGALELASTGDWVAGLKLKTSVEKNLARGDIHICESLQDKSRCVIVSATMLGGKCS